MLNRSSCRCNRMELPHVSVWSNLFMLTIAIDFSSGYQLSTHYAGDPTQHISVQVLDKGLHERVIWPLPPFLEQPPAQPIVQRFAIVGFDPTDHR